MSQKAQTAQKPAGNVFKRIGLSLQKNGELLLLCIPALVGYIMFHYIPMFGVITAFIDYKPAKGFLGSKWMGLYNFQYLFKSVELQRIVVNTVTYSLIFIVTGFVANLLIAMLLHEIADHRGALKYYQTTMVFPNFMSVVIIGYITYAIFNPTLGVLNAIRGTLGLDAVNVYMDQKPWRFILTSVNLWWGVGMGSMLYFAALIGIDASLYEAARIDGANRVQQIIHISLPGLRTIISIQLILSLSGIFSGSFGLFYTIPRNQQILYPVTDIIETYTYRGLVNARYSATAAVGLTQNLVGFVLIMITNGIVRKISPDDSLF